LKERLDDPSGHLCEEKFQKPYVRIIVQDTGCGMDQTTQAHIFDPFFTTKETGRGTGLGLASVYGIIKAHDGCIHCSSTLGKGTRFTIFWPAAKAKTADSSQAPAILTQKQIPGGTETVLVVDDESDIRELTAEALARFGYRILTAESGEEAVEVYSKHSSDIDLVVLDLNMPGMGGHECLAGLLRYDPKPLVLVASGYSSRGQIEKSLETGAAGFIAKPFELQTLMDKIREILDHNAGKA
jgi:CheY-like chemotaxis protein